MEQIILDVQDNIELKEQANKEKMKLVKEVANHYHINKYAIYDYADYLHYKGNGWEDGNPLKLIPQTKFKDRVSPTFIRLLKIINDLRDVDDLGLLNPYLEALKVNGIEIKITPHDALDDRTFLDDYMTLINEQQCIICDNTDIVRDKGEEAAYNQFCTKGKFKELAESYYKLQNGIKPEKVVDKLSKDMMNNHLDINGINEIIGEQAEEDMKEDD